MTPEQQKLVLDNDRIVYSTLKRFNIPSYEYNDYKQEGLLALCRAAVNFNPEIGKFSTYAFRGMYIIRYRLTKINVHLISSVLKRVECIKICE